MRDAGFFFIWLVLLPISFYSAHIGVLLWVWVALMNPNELLYGIMAGVPYNKIVAGTTMLIMIANRERKDFYVDLLIALVGIFFVCVTVSYMAALVPGVRLDNIYDKFWKQALLFVLITGIMWSRHRLHQLALVAAVAYGFLMVKEGLIFLLTAGGHKVVGVGSTGDNNGLALAILMTIPLVLYVSKYSALRWVRLAILATAAMGAVTVIATFSRGGFVGLIVLGLMLLKGSKYKLRAMIAMAALGLALAILAPEEWYARISTVKEAGEDFSFMSRVVSWKINFFMALDRPFLGGGMSASLDPAIWSKYLLESRDFLFQTPLVQRTFVAHSIYFQVIGDLGFIGFGVFVAMIGTAFLMAGRTIRLAKGIPSLLWAADLARAFQVSLAVYAVAGGALSLVYFELLFIILAMVSRTHRTVVQATAGQKVANRQAMPARLQPAIRVSA